MKFINFAIVKFSLCLVFGILAAHFFPVSKFLLSYLLLLFFIVIGLWYWARKQLIQNVYFGITIYLSFFAIGYVNYQMRLPRFQVNHFTHYINETAPKFIQLKILKTFKADSFNFKYLAEVEAVNKQPTEGKILVNLAKDSLPNTLFIDQNLVVYSTITEIPAALNPHQFNYSEYMQTLGAYAQLRITENEILQRWKGAATLTGIAQNYRSSIIKKLQKTELTKDERAIIQALVLGEKKDIDKALYNEYAAAGAVHILAVSGLHVGILFILLSFLTKPLLRFKKGVLFQSVIIVVCLWSFALLSGLSPSVTRAVTMFSFFALALLLKRETNSINTLFLSFFALLVINPLWLFQVGFQLSYLAVFFILWLLPFFYKIGYSKYPIVRKIWTIISVSICAQIGVLPLSLYYFHQFPGLFLLTNIVILPFLTILMVGGIIIVVLASFDSLPLWLERGYNFLIELLNNFIHWVANQEAFLFQDIHFSTPKVIGAYLLIFSVCLFVMKTNIRRLIISLISIAILVTIYTAEAYANAANKLIVFQKSRNTIIGYKNGRNLKIYTNHLNEEILSKYPIKAFRVAENTSSFSLDKIPKIFQYKKKKILVIDSLGLYPKNDKIHTVIMSNSPKINFNRLIDSLKPQQVIADGSNYYSFVKQWENSCKLKKLPFWHTAKQGAFLFD